MTIPPTSGTSSSINTSTAPASHRLERSGGGSATVSVSSGRFGSPTGSAAATSGGKPSVAPSTATSSSTYRKAATLPRILRNAR
mgnify:CR=1 FL=1